MNQRSIFFIKNAFSIKQGFQKIYVPENLHAIFKFEKTVAGKCKRLKNKRFIKSVAGWVL